MSWDLAISNHGDLEFLANMDIAGKSGVDLIEQRIFIRLKVWRGSWVYDDDENFGSQVYRLTGISLTAAQRAAQAYVNEALRAMTEIAVDDVTVEQDGAQLKLVVNYHVISESISSRNDAQSRVEIAIPVGGSV